ncbi:MAG: hypothetical protein DMF37_01660, partial [Verrucomicrobia bacterium]
MKLFFLAGAVFAIIGRVGAGSMELAPKETAPPSITESEPWQFTIAAPGWMAGMDGTIGINGHNADIDIGLDQILQHLDMIFAMRAQAQKGPFGIFAEFIYTGLSGGAQMNGLVDNFAAHVDTAYVDGGLSWRLINTPRWSLDFAAGSHYANLYEQLILNSNPVAINQASERFVTNISDDLRDRLNNDISNSEFLASLTSTIKQDIASRLGNALDRFERKPTIPIGPLGGRIRQEVANIVEDLIRVKERALRARIDALHLSGDARRAAVNRIVSAAMERITRDLAATLNSKLSETLSRDDYWFAPYVGLRTRYNFNKTFYTAVRGEVGGFGAGPDLMWQVEGVIGINLTRSIFTEVGYRALATDYDNDGLLF